MKSCIAHVHALARGLALALSLTLALAGCYQYDAPACTVACATNSDCPGSLVCTPAGRCAATAATACDADIDAAPDAAPQMIRVNVFDDRGKPAVGVRVIAAKSDGTAVADVTSGTNGVAMFVATSDVDVTVVRTDSLGASLTTLRGAAPGDTLSFGRRPNETPSVMRTVTWPPFASATNYSIFASCGGGAQINVGTVTSKTILVEPACADDYDVMVVYTTNTIGEQGFKVKTAASGTTAFPNDGWATLTSESANFTQIPASLTNGSVTFAGATVFRPQQRAFGEGGLGSVLIGTPTATSNLALPVAGMAARELTTRVTNDADIKASQLVAERLAPTGQYNLAIEPAMLPWIASAPAADLSARYVTWASGSVGAQQHGIDLVAAEVVYDRGTLRYRWRVIAPPSALAMTGGGGSPLGFRLSLPDVPGSETFEPLATDSIPAGLEPVVHLYGFNGPTYADLRRDADLSIAMTTNPYTTTDTFLVDGVITRFVVSVRVP